MAADLFSTAAAAAGKALGSAAARRIYSSSPRLGTEVERRVVYAQFAQAITRWAMFTQQIAALRQQRLSVLNSKLWDPMPDRLYDLQVGMFTSYQELHLVADPLVLAAGDEVLTLAGELIGLANDRQKAQAFEERMQETVASLRKFTEVCKVDLAYGVSRWNVAARASRWRATGKERKALAAGRQPRND